MAKDDILRKYSFKLLISYLPENDDQDLYLSECRMIFIEENSDNEAVLKAIKIGKEGEFSGNSEDGEPMQFKFVGIIDCVYLDPLLYGENEVWYDIIELDKINLNSLPLSRSQIMEKLKV